MKLARKALILAVLAGLLLAPAASAHGIATLTVPDAAYQPGASVVVTGQFVDPEITALPAPATVTLGIDGPVVGQAPMAADGTWTLTFTLPLDATFGTYVLAASVLNADGSLATGLLARAALVVGTPAAAPADAVAPGGAPDVQLSQLDTARRGDVALAAAVEAAAAAVANAANELPAAATVTRHVAAPIRAKPVAHAKPASHTKPSVRAKPVVQRLPAQPVARTRATIAVTKPVSHARRHALESRVAHALPQAQAPRLHHPEPEVAAKPGPSGAHHRSALPSIPLLLVAGVLLLLLETAGTWAILFHRRRGKLAAIEAELQALIAEERASEVTRETLGV